jgi:tetrahydromethanopterin S-methyltransferase subunit A
MSASKGIKRYGEKAIVAIIKEFKQLNDGAMDGKPVVIPIDPKDLSREGKRRAMEAIMLIK